MSVEDYNKLEYDVTFKCFTVKQLNKAVKEITDKINNTNYGFCDITLNVKFNDRNTCDFYSD